MLVGHPHPLHKSLSLLLRLHFQDLTLVLNPGNEVSLELGLGSFSHRLAILTEILVPGVFRGHFACLFVDPLSGSCFVLCLFPLG